VSGVCCLSVMPPELAPEIGSHLLPAWLHLMTRCLLILSAPFFYSLQVWFLPQCAAGPPDRAGQGGSLSGD
jgi:hypothetical protein